jgi:hypothetical protein
VADLQFQCVELAALGLEGPCRFDPQAELAAFDSLVRPRAESDPVAPPARALRPLPVDLVGPRVRAGPPTR